MENLPNEVSPTRGSGALIAGILLILIGAFLLCGTVASTSLARFGIDVQLWRLWPTIFLFVGAAFFLPIFLSWERRRQLAGLAVPGTIILMQWVLFTYFTWTDNWGDWAFLWAAEPLSVGLGLYVMYFLGEPQRGLLIGASIVSGISLVFLSLFATFLAQGLFRVIGPLLLIVIGIVVVLVTFLQGRSR